MASTEHGTGPTDGGGRRPSAVMYRRRRLAVAVLGLLVLAALAVGGAAMAGLLGGQDGAGDPSAAASTSPGLSASRTPPSASATPGAAPSATPSAAPTSTGAGPSSSGKCDPASVVVVAATDERTYSPDETPVLSLVIRNKGAAPCTVNVGTSQMEFVLTRGDDRVFSSVDCQESSEDLDRVIEPKGEERATFEWARNRTVPGCTVVDGEPGAGEYTLTTRLGARSSAPVTFTLR